MKDLYWDFHRINKILKRLEEKRNELRDDILAEAQIHNFEHSYVLPSKSLRIPRTYFEATGHTIQDFASLRYPGWNLVSYTQDGDDAILIFKKKERFGSFSHAGEFKTDVTPSEATPKVDWESLEKEFPGMVDKIARPITGYELDEEKFRKELQDNPDLSEIMARHIISKVPTMRVTSKEIKSED